MNKTQKMLVLSMLGITVIVASMMIGGIGFSYDVMYDGEKVGRISDLAVYNEARTIAKANVAYDKSEGLTLETPKFVFNFSFEAPDTSAEELSTSIISHSDDVISGYSVSIDGKESFFVADKALVQKAIEDYCASFDVEGLECTSTVKNEISYNDAFVESHVVANEDDVKNAVSGLDVTTVANKVTTYYIPYETVTTRTSSKKTGYIAVTTAGVNGVNEKVEKITYSNGVQISTEVVSDSVIAEPVTEKVLVGTGKSTYSTVVHNASTKGYVWPLEVKGTITSYWGDGRNHKGLDIAAPAGTEIHAVKAGTVVLAGWDKDYGYNVIIDHGNGVKTRYAHSRKLHVKVGDKVSQGQFIAEVGTTGQSTGNHCHFEVVINGTRVNPAPYLGI
ncbi:MAG: peptidoglycan DD-metalloendopeptidase family protein [Clostridia bacterium]|nr:peptidoglycan DD-metalloendopeptidase family protein [Clostridia bacterium]